MALEFFVKLGKVGLRLAGLVGAPRGSSEYGRPPVGDHSSLPAAAN